MKKALSLGVPQGPLLGKLKGGHAVTLPDGRVIEPSACVEGGTAGAVVVLLACPSRQHITGLAAHDLWKSLPPPPTASPVAQGPKGEEQPVRADLVVHFAGRDVLSDGAYVALTNRISRAAGATHILLHQSACEPEVS